MPRASKPKRLPIISLEPKPFKNIYTDSQQFSKIPEDPPSPKSKIRRLPPRTYLERNTKKKRQMPPPRAIVREPIVRPRKMVMPENFIHHKRKLFEDLPVYEPTDTDIMFVKGHEKKFMYEGYSILTVDLVSNATMYMYSMERKFQKKQPLMIWMTEFFNKCYPELQPFCFFHKLKRLLYGYWLARRKQYNFPIYRGNWHLGQMQLQGTTISERCYPAEEVRKHRLHKKTAEVIAEDMNKQFSHLSVLCQKMARRQELKMKQVTENIKQLAEVIIDYGNPDLEEVLIDNLPEDIFMDMYTPRGEKIPKMIHRLKGSKSHHKRKKSKHQKQNPQKQKKQEILIMQPEEPEESEVIDIEALAHRKDVLDRIERLHQYQKNKTLVNNRAQIDINQENGIEVLTIRD